MIEHTITLKGQGFQGSRFSAVVLHDVLDIILIGAKESIRLRTEGRSCSSGAEPAWLSKVTAFGIVDIEAGSTVIKLQAPSLVEAAPEKFALLQSHQFWVPLDTSSTAFSAFQESLFEAISGKADSELFDTALLTTFARFGSILDEGVESVEIDEGNLARPIKIGRNEIETVLKLRMEIPASQSVTISGVLQSCSDNNSIVDVILESGDVVKVVASQNQLNSVSKLVGKSVLVSGRVLFRPSGAVLRIDSSSIIVRDSLQAILSQLPKPLGYGNKLGVTVPQSPTSGMSNVFGKWPGSESDEQIAFLLGERP